MMINLPRLSTISIMLFGALTIMTSLTVKAELRLEIPEETFGPPFYARLEIPTVDPVLIPSDGEWAALVLYRQRQCIPESFNLLSVFDVPAAFDCPLGNFAGYEVYANAPDVDPAPTYSRLTGSGPVSIWFVRLEEFQQAAADGNVTIVDFEEMPSLRMGSASFYDELLRPSQSNPEILLHLNAHGSFEDGGGFRLTYTVTGNPEDETRVRTRIEFPAASELPTSAPLVAPYTGHWFDPANPGEGLGLHPVRGTQTMYGTWFTVSPSGEQIWYALDSTAFDGIRANFDVLLSHGPDPDSPNGVALETVGHMQIDFLTCTTAVASFAIDDSSGEFDLVSLVPADNCRD